MIQTLAICGKRSEQHLILRQRWQSASASAALPVASMTDARLCSEAAAASDRLPPVRAGLAYGSVLSRFGDVYGPVVNIASRLTGLARPGTVLVDRDLAAALSDAGAYDIRRIRAVPVRGYHHLAGARLRRRSTR